MQQVSTAVVPQLMRVSRGADMSFAGEAVKAIAAVVNTLGLYGAGGAGLVILTVFATLPVWTGPLRVLAEGAPPWSLYRDLRGASFLAQLTLLQGGGVRLEDALARLWELASPWLRERINALLQGVRNGLTLGNAAYEAGYDFPAPAAIRFLRTIAGNEESAHSIEEFAQDWYVYTLERLEKLIVTVSTGGVLFFYGVIFLIYGAMNDITNVMVAAPGGAR
jgi:type II secretory pathway component PulF